MSRVAVCCETSDVTRKDMRDDESAKFAGSVALIDVLDAAVTARS
jgi:hypothetical protein